MVNFIQRITHLASFTFLLLTFPGNISLAQQNQADITKTRNKLPATHLHFNDDTSKLQFAIISDLWGDYRPGVFEDAVDKLELIQPQFVMSVGDLIDGKTYDPLLLDKQWNEFNVLVNSLSMPFFYVPGNHDISNAWMEMEWEKRLGLPYYYFIHKNALFLCLNTQDGGSSGIGTEQIAYFIKAIEDYPDVRWIFIFMHRPVWRGKIGEEEGYEKIEAALTGKNYTVFSGHNHTYLNVIKNGNKHFVLGSTGGGSGLHGEKFGEFDHITWVTLNADEPPKIINLKLNGLVKEDVVNENTYPITSALLNQDWLVTPTYVIQNRFEKALTSAIIFINPTPYPLKISGYISDVDGCTIDPLKLNVTIPPHGQKQELVTIKSAGESEIDLSSLSFIELNLKGTYFYDTVVYEIPVQRKLFFNWMYVLPELPDAKKMMNTKFENPDTADFISVFIPEYIHNRWYWHGTEDCLLHFKLARDNRHIYLVAFIKDDQIVTDNKKEQDLIYVDMEDKNGAPFRITIYPGPSRSTLWIDEQTGLAVQDFQLKSTVNESGFIKIMLGMPVNEIVKADNSFRFNIGYRDQDNTTDRENSTLYWKPLWGSEADYLFSGTFMIKNQN